MKKIRVLYAGDSPADGPARYLLGILKNIKANVLHLAPSEILKPGLLKKQYDVIILSDFACSNTPDRAQKEIANQVERGAGLLMVGGWGSFSGPFGRWRESLIEKLLPVSCLNRDDRTAFPSGAAVVVKNQHAMYRPAIFKKPPIVCGINEVKPKKNSRILLSVKDLLISQKIQQGKLKVKPDSKEYPLLVIDSDPQKRIAALSTDAAPHWCGGLLDWGTKHHNLRIAKGIKIFVGNYYIEFFSSLIQWLAGK